MKGISRHAASEVCVVIDTSGSISRHELEQFFGEIEAIAKHAKINVLQWDYDFQGYGKYRKGEWKNIEIHGRGGTRMDAAIDWIDEQGLNPDLVVLLTDGYTGWPSQKPFPFVVCITEENTSEPDWARLFESRFLARGRKVGALPMATPLIIPNAIANRQKTRRSNKSNKRPEESRRESKRQCSDTKSDL